jgi:O-antigen ligase
MTVLFFLGFRKSVIIGAVMVFIIAISIPRVREAVFFQDAAGKNRLALWSFSWDYATASPYQFVFGAGLRQFHQKVQAPALHFNFTKMEKLIYPHTTLFNFWMETGLLGALSFIGLTAYQMYLSLKTWEKNIDLGSVMVGMVVAMVVQGLVDVPYFKNDLAVVWWGLFAILVCAMLSDVNSKSVES